MSEGMEVAKKEEVSVPVVAGFGTESGFDLMKRQAKALSMSKLVPKHFQGNLPDCIISLEMAQRMGASPLMVCQNLYVVHGNPTFSAKFLVACINASGRFSPLRYKFTGTKGKDDWGCIAWATDHTGEKLESAEVTIGIAKAEGWYEKNGSKWQTIPQLMLQYRSATFFCRTYAPEVGMGMMTTEEAQDMQPAMGIVEEPLFKEPVISEDPKPSKLVSELEAIAESRADDLLDVLKSKDVDVENWQSADESVLAEVLDIVNDM